MGRADVPVYRAGRAALNAFNPAAWHGDAGLAARAARIRTHYLAMLPHEARAFRPRSRADDGGLPSAQALQHLLATTHRDSTAPAALWLRAKVKLEGEHANGVRSVLGLPHHPDAAAAAALTVAVFCPAHLAAAALAAGATFAGGAELAAQLLAPDAPPGSPSLGAIDRAVATTDALPFVARLARVLGPRGLMPTAKTGTLVPATADALAAATAAARAATPVRIERDAARFEVALGDVSWDAERLRANMRAALDWLAAQRRTVDSGRFVEHAALVARPESGPEAAVDIAGAEFGAATGARYVQAVLRLREQVAARAAARAACGPV